VTHPTRTLIRSAAALLVGALASPLAALAQAHPTAEANSRLSFFAGANGANTGLYNGKNAGITAGADLEVFHLFGLHPAIELRGTYPFSDGSSVALKNAMAGLRLEKRFGPVHPYADFLFGRGELNYQNGGLLSKDGSTYYLQSLSNVWSPGGGAEVDVTRRFALRLDVQLQHYNSPITNSGTEWATSATVGVTYRLRSRGNGYSPR
jgi:hypothetical protein